MFKPFACTGRHWLVYSGLIYLGLTVAVALSSYKQYTIFVQGVWICLMILPLMCNPLARWLNMKENCMFDWMKKNKMPSNVLPFPKPAEVPYIEPPAPAPEPESKTFYSIGITSDARVSLKVGEHTTLVLNRAGLTNLISQLEVFEKQLPEE